MDLKKFESYEVFVGEQIDDFKKRNDNNTNHFAMVENFIEKYLPLQIQSQISQTLQSCLPFQAQKQLELYEIKKNKELHQVVLDDDGIPDLFTGLQRITFDVKKIDITMYIPKKPSVKMRTGKTSNILTSQSSVKGSIEVENGLSPSQIHHQSQSDIEHKYDSQTVKHSAILSKQFDRKMKYLQQRSSANDKDADRLSSGI